MSRLLECLAVPALALACGGAALLTEVGSWIVQAPVFSCSDPVVLSGPLPSWP